MVHGCHTLFYVRNVIKSTTRNKDKNKTKQTTWDLKNSFWKKNESKKSKMKKQQIKKNKWKRFYKGWNIQKLFFHCILISFHFHSLTFPSKFVFSKRIYGVAHGYQHKLWNRSLFKKFLLCRLLQPMVSYYSVKLK